MRVVGITGPTGAGKTTVCRLLAQNPGVIHLDCDRLAWETYRPGGPAYSRILLRFGKEILAENGSVNREKLGAIALRDPKAKADLEEIVHPLVMARVEEEVERARKRGMRLALVEGALLLSSPHVNKDFFDLFVWLAVEENERRIRLRKAGLSEALIARRFSAQADLTPPSLPNLVVVEGSGSPPEVAKRVMTAIANYFGETLTSS